MGEKYCQKNYDIVSHRKQEDNAQENGIHGVGLEIDTKTGDTR